MNDSRPPSVVAEAQRISAEIIAHVHNDIEWRVKISESVARNEAQSSYMQLRMDSHERNDDERFARVFGNQPSISSQVIGLEREHRTLSGAKMTLIAIAAVLAWLITTGISVWAALK